jgi:hypothetical protein
LRQAPWDTLSYQRIVAARFNGDESIVDFEDGSRVSLDPRPLVPPPIRHPDWAGVAVNEYELVVPSQDGPLEIPLDVIRDRTDPRYDAHWESVSHDSAHWIGARIRSLRESKHPTIDDLSKQSRIPEQVLLSLEIGLDVRVEADVKPVLEATDTSTSPIRWADPGVRRARLDGASSP